MPESAREKISMFSHVDKDQVISMPDVNNIFKVPLVLFEHKIAGWLAERLSLKSVTQRLLDYSARIASDSMESAGQQQQQPSIMQRWIELSERSDSLTKEVTVALVGKYTTQSDTYTSIIKSLEHAGLESNRKIVMKVSRFLFFFK
jgi:CTP synthase